MYKIECPYYRVLGETVAGSVCTSARGARDDWLDKYRESVADDEADHPVRFAAAKAVESPILLAGEYEEGLMQAEWEHFDGGDHSANMYGLVGWVFQLDWSYAEHWRGS